MKRQSIFLTTFAVFFLISLVVLAERGGWIGSGGESVRFSKNPWFVKNTTIVPYCVVIDKASISADEATVRTAIANAISYWKGELNTQGAPPGPGFAVLGTQSFVEQTACDSTTLLQILVGYGALNAEQVKFLEEPRQYIGISVRTDYDTVNLLGKGFVYISSDLGSMAYNTLPNTGHLVPQAWQNPKLLQYAFMHEFGHIFGFPHTGTGLMSEVFLDQVLNQRFSKFYLDNPLQSFLNSPSNFDVCGLGGSFHTGFFGVPANTACLRLEGSTQGDTLDWNVFAKQTVASAPALIGTLHGDRILQSMLGMKSASVIQLPPEQQVFTLQDRFINNFMIGPLFNEGTAKGVFMATGSHRPFDVLIDFRLDSITITGIVNQRMVPVLSYSPPSLLNKMLPIGPTVTSPRSGH